jgi:hypothetical protein
MGYAEDNPRTKQFLPDESLDVCEENLHLFFKTMFDRQQIWYKRFIKKQEAPWTKDKFFKNFKFTNVYRELDRNSQFQIENFFKTEKNRKELIWKIMFFRFFNQPEFFKFIEEITIKSDEAGACDFSFIGMIPSYDSFKPEELKSLMEAYREQGGNPFTNAYLTNSQACPGKTRDECFAFKVIPTLHSLIPKISKTLLMAKSPEEIIKLLMTLPSVSNFMAHEFYQDFTYAPRYSNIMLMKFDQDDFTNVGPGAEVGIRLIFPNRKGTKDKLQAIYDLRDLAVDYMNQFGDFKYLGYNGISENYFIDFNKPKITLHQIEMWLCEFQKYWKMQIGEGKQRSQFKPKTIIK